MAESQIDLQVEPRLALIEVYLAGARPDEARRWAAEAREILEDSLAGGPPGPGMAGVVAHLETLR